MIVFAGQSVALHALHRTCGHCATPVPAGTRPYQKKVQIIPVLSRHCATLRDVSAGRGVALFIEASVARLMWTLCNARDFLCNAPRLTCDGSVAQCRLWPLHRVSKDQRGALHGRTPHVVGVRATSESSALVTVNGVEPRGEGLWLKSG